MLKVKLSTKLCPFQHHGLLSLAFPLKWWFLQFSKTNSSNLNIATDINFSCWMMSVTALRNIFSSLLVISKLDLQHYYLAFLSDSRHYSAFPSIAQHYLAFTISSLGWQRRGDQHFQSCYMKIFGLSKFQRFRDFSGSL